MAPLQCTIRTIVALAETHRVGAIFEAEQAVDAYLACFSGYRERTTALDMLRHELAKPERRAVNRGGLFEQVQIYIDRQHRLLARDFQ